MTEMTLIAVVCLMVGAAAAGAVAFVMLRPRPGEAVEAAAAAATAELARAQSEAASRLEGMINMLARGQTQLQSAMAERLDAVSHRMNQSMATTTQQTVERLQGLHERLAVIDRAQKNISELSSQVTSLHSVLGNKQQRGAFGQGRMEIIIQDALPKGSYEFQFTLSNRTRPDCCIFLPEQPVLVIDAKFPLEAVTAYRAAASDEERKQAAARLRSDVGKHVSDIASKYMIPGETQDVAFMFVPSESVYADLHEEFDDIVQKAFRARVMIVSPMMLMLAIQVVQQMQRDSRMREAANQIHVEVGKLLEDVRRMRERVMKLRSHFEASEEDVRQIILSSEKIEKRGVRMTEVDFQDNREGATIIPAPMTRKLEAGE